MKAKKFLLTISSMGLLVPSITITTACLTSCGPSSSAVKVQSIEISSDKTSFEINDTFNLSSKVLPENASNKALQWISDNTQVATVDSTGKLTAKAVGTCNISAKSTDGSNITSNKPITITVFDKEIKITNISLSTTIKGYRNNTLTLTPTITPSNATNKELEWSLEDPTVATLDSTTGLTNKIKFVKNNSTTNLILKAKDGSRITKSFPVTVDNDYIIENKQIVNGDKIKSSSFDQSTLKADSEIDISYTTTASDNFINADSVSVKYGNNTLTQNVDYFVASHENKIKIPSLKDKYSTDAKLEINLVGKQIEDTTTIETAEQYMADRTFSVYIQNSTQSGQSFVGTCWILSDSTPDISTDYNYYIATNWHVRALHGTSSTLSLASANSSSQTLYANDYIQVSNTKIAWEDEENFMFEPKEDNRGIDFFVGNFDLAEITTSNDYKDKLDKLNKLTEANKPITKIAPISSEYSNYKELDMYEMGYPSYQYKYSKFSKQDSDRFSCSQFISSDTIKYTNVYHKGQEYTIFPKDYSKTLKAGSSGSMLVAKIDNQWQVIGIKWGGDNDAGTCSSYHIFNFCTGDYHGDFISKYITIK